MQLLKSLAFAAICAAWSVSCYAVPCGDLRISVSKPNVDVGEAFTVSLAAGIDPGNNPPVINTPVIYHPPVRYNFTVTVDGESPVYEATNGKFDGTNCNNAQLGSAAVLT